MKKYFQSGIIILLVLWLFGALIYLPSTQDKLLAAAKPILAHADNEGIFAQVKVEFKGQEATLTGPVATAEEKSQAGKLISTRVRLPGWFTSAINPVTAVHNRITVDPENAPPRPRPWLILSLFGDNQRIDGILKSATQRQDLLTAIAAKLPPPASPLNNQISIAENSLPCPNWDATHTRIPDLSATPNDKPIIAATDCNGKWTTFPASVSNTEIAATLKASSIRDYEITHALAKLRTWSPPSPQELKIKADQKAAAEAAAKNKPDASAPIPPDGTKPDGAGTNNTAPAAAAPDKAPAAAAPDKAPAGGTDLQPE